MFEETKLIDYLRIILREELKVRETTSKKLLWKQFVSTIKETGLKSQINLEDTLGSFEDDDDFAEHVPAVAVRAGGVFSARCDIKRSQFLLLLHQQCSCCCRRGAATLKCMDGGALEGNVT